MAHVLVDVVLREHIVAKKAARLAFAQHVGYPRKAAVRVVGAVGGTVFKETPVGIDHEQPVVAYALGLGYLVAVHARLPRPFAHGNLFGVTLVELNAIRKLGEAALAVGLLAIPLHRRAHHRRVGRLGSHALAVVGARLAAHREVCTGPSPDGSVAGAVAEDRGGEHDALRRLDVLYCN